MDRTDFYVFDDDIIVFDRDSGRIVASRTASGAHKSCSTLATPPALRSQSSPSTRAISPQMFYDKYEGRDAVFCSMGPSSPICFLIRSTDEDSSHRSLDLSAEQLLRCFEQSYPLFSTTKSEGVLYAPIFDYLVRISSFCGAKTDIGFFGNEAELSPSVSSFVDYDSLFVSSSLLIIALMYRRISSRRGFNFKFLPASPFVCLGFSARVFLNPDDSLSPMHSIPELSAIKDAADRLGVVVATSCTTACDNPDGCAGERAELYRLAVAICPQTHDPSGLLHEDEFFSEQKLIAESMLAQTYGIF